MVMRPHMITPSPACCAACAAMAKSMYGRKQPSAETARLSADRPRPIVRLTGRELLRSIDLTNANQRRANIAAGPRRPVLSSSPRNSWYQAYYT